MASFKNTIELPDSIDTDTNGILTGHKKGLFVYMNEWLRAYSGLSEDAGKGLSVGDLILNSEGDAPASISLRSVRKDPLLRRSAL